MKHKNVKYLIANLSVSLFALVLMISCGERVTEYDATGVFEATEVTVSAEQNGKIMQFNVDEGDRVSRGYLVGTIDTTQLYLKAKQMGVSRQVYATQRPDMNKQVAATRQQLVKARKDYNRYADLVKAGAANRKCLDDALSQVKVLERQLDAQLSSLTSSNNSLNAQMGSLDIQKLQVIEQLSKCYVHSPISGTVLEKYMEQGEFATIGKPLFKVAYTDYMYLRAYITSSLLKRIKIGQSVKVFANYGDGEKTAYSGLVTWISAKSEFTPKTILTDDERADLVYAVKIRVKNDGYIKIGMYGEVKF